MSELPKTYRKVQVKVQTRDVQKALEIVEETTPTSIKDEEVLVKTLYVGVNASDLNSLVGSYNPGVPPPYTVGLEALGIVVVAGSKSGHKVGQHVVHSGLGCYTEYRVIRGAVAIPIPVPDKKLLTLPISGLTAYIAIGELAHVKKGEVALVTAAAGGTGQFAVQVLKKIYGCTVIGTCSNDEKRRFLESLGCDRVINYKTEKISDVLSKEYPKGVDIVYESVGGETFDACLDNLAIKGRIICIGAITSYAEGSFPDSAPSSPENNKDKDSTTRLPLQIALLKKSATVHGFLLPHFMDVYGKYMGEMFGLVQDGTIVCSVDETPFHGIESIPRAIEHLHSGKSFGKVMVSLTPHDAVKE